MADFLLRDQAPLTSVQWAALDLAVIQTAQALVVGRRIIPLVGPFGRSIEGLPSDTLAGSTTGQIDLLSNTEGEVVGVEHRRYLPLPLVYKDFWIHGRSLEADRQFGLPLDISKAAAACAQAEDHLVFNGDSALGLPGLLGISICCGFSKELLPISLQVIGPSFDDFSGYTVRHYGKFYLQSFLKTIAKRLYEYSLC